MKINNRNGSAGLRKILLIAAAIVVVGAAALGAYIYMTQQKKMTDGSNISPTGVNYGPATDEQKAAGDREKDETINKVDDDGSSPTSNDTLGVSFTAINQADGQLQIRTLVDTVSSAGSCVLTLTKNGVTVTKQSDIQAGPTSSTCKGFNVPVTELSLGVWQVKVQVTIGAQKGSASQAYTVQ